MGKHNEVLTYGVLEQTLLKDKTDGYVEELRCNGFTILPDVFSAADIAKTSRLIDSIYETQKQSVGGVEALSRMGDEDIVRCPLAYDEHFLALATEPTIQEIITKVLGKSYVLMMQNAIINRADREQYQTRWHRDLNYQHWTSTQPLALNFLVAVDRFYRDGGATWVLPGSQRYEQFPSVAFTQKYQHCLEAEPGSVIVMDAMAYHRAGQNLTPGYIRRGVNHVVGLPFIGQQVDIPAMLAKRGIDYSKDPFLSAYLGYRWNPSPDVESWRRQRMK